jgi:membrane protein implicated in regulation of membrane protease activity
MTGRLIREFVIDLVVFLVVAMATPFVGFVASLILPFSLFQWGLMTLAAAIFGVAIQRRVWADRLEMYRDELVRQADAQARGERA